MTADRVELPIDPPPGWMRTESPRTIAILGWASVSNQAREGSGYNLVASETAAGLALSGHTVHALRSGMHYSFRPGIRIEPEDPWRGVSQWRLVNSPNLSPAVFNFRNMERERSAPAESAAVLRWLDRVRADLVHIHSLEGYPLDLIPKVRDSGRPVVVTPHNYWFVCPQVDLLRNETHVCTDYEGGKACETCLTPAPPNRARARRRIEQFSARRLGPVGAAVVRSFLRHRPKLVIPNLGLGSKKGRDDLNDPPVDPDLALGFDLPAADRSGLIGPEFPVDETEELTPLGKSPIDQNERFLNATHHLRVLNDYGRRRVEGIAALNAAAVVTPPSAFMADTHERMGLDADRLRVLRLGLPHLDRIYRRTAAAPTYRTRPWSARHDDRPLRFGFFGTVRHNKGIDILVRAIQALDPSVRARCHFMLHAGGGDWLHRRRLARHPEVSFLGGYDLLHLVSAGATFDVGVLPHIWFENSPIVLLEFLSAGKFVLASRLGGPPEWIREPAAGDRDALGNGLMFPGGDPEALAERITRLATGTVTLPSPAEIHAMSPIRSYPDYMAEVEAIYRRALGELPRPAEPGFPPASPAQASSNA